MSDFKDRMIEAIERGETTEAEAYEYVREQDANAPCLHQWSAERRREADLLQDDDGSGVDE